jgi:hypothetical protein
MDTFAERHYTIAELAQMWFISYEAEEVDRAIASIRALRERNKKVTVEELLSARDEGRKY